MSIRYIFLARTLVAINVVVVVAVCVVVIVVVVVAVDTPVYLSLSRRSNGDSNPPIVRLKLDLEGRFFIFDPAAGSCGDE